jgi:RNA polymerase sigma factor (sigma-70 family)
MSTHLVDGVDVAVKSRLKTYWAKKLARLNELLVPYPPDLQEIRLTVSYHQPNSKRSYYEGRGIIQLPTGTLVAEATGEDPQAILDRIADTLAAEIKRHKEKVRRDYIFKRKNRNRADLSAAGPALQRQRDSEKRDDFFRLLRKHLPFLRDYARREIRILDRDGTLHRGEATVDDLLDQVLVLAWERFDDRPTGLSLDLWLTDLMEEALEQWIKQEPRPHVSLEARAEEVLPDDGPQEDEEDWWVELMGEEEILTLEDLIPGSDGTEIWERLEAEDQQVRLLSLLGQLSATQRQAFLLHAVEGYTTDEIAMLQDRREGDVKADIDDARKRLREGLIADRHVEAESQHATAVGIGT